MAAPRIHKNPFSQSFGDAGFFETLINRRSRRFGLGMQMQHGPMTYKSRHAALPLSEADEAALCFAACGISGYALSDLIFDADAPGGSIMGGFVGRTISSGDAIQAVALIVTNDSGTWLLKRPADFETDALHELIALARAGELEQVYRKSRIKISEARCAPPLEAPFNLGVNQWDMYAPGTSYFLPVSDFTYMYINGVLEFFAKHMGMFVVDERAQFRPAGVRRFARSKGGWLNDDPGSGRTITIERLEGIVQMVVTIEAGMMLQNLGLAAQALGLGGFPNWAGHEFAWFDALGFERQTMPGLKYIGAPRYLQKLASVFGRDKDIGFPTGLQRDGEILLQPYCPPYYADMRAAVLAVVERKYGASGVFRGGVERSGFATPAEIAAAIPNADPDAIEATIAYCSYVLQRYGRFPAYSAPYRTTIGFQATHLDTEFYDKFYKPEALGRQQRERALQT